MRWEWSEKTVIGLAVLICALLFAFGWATREPQGEKPYLVISGGGFIFNYRNAEAFYGFSSEVVRPLANGSIIEATFENPAGGQPFVKEERVSAMTNSYSLRTPALHGVAAHHPYKVSIRVYDRLRKDLLWETERTYSSQLSDDVLPKHPLTLGPGYQRLDNLNGG